MEGIGYGYTDTLPSGEISIDRVICASFIYFGTISGITSIFIVVN